jgi:hypothetical protein
MRGRTKGSIAWIAYAALLTLGVVAGEVLNVVRGERPGAVAIANWLLTAALLTALWGYVLRRPFGNARYWRAVFWLVTVTMLVMLLPTLYTGGTVALAAGALTVLVVPAYVGAWRYAYRSPELWEIAG